MLVDQLMCVKYVLWRKSMFSSKRAIYLSILIISIFFLVNVHLNFTIKYSVNRTEGNSTFIDLLTSSEIILVWFKVSLESYFYSHFRFLNNLFFLVEFFHLFFDSFYFHEYFDWTLVLPV